VQTRAESSDKTNVGVKKLKDGPAIVVLTRRHYPYSNIILGVGIFLIGFLIYTLHKNPSSFLGMPYFYLGTFGIIFVSLVMSWGFALIDKITEELKSIFEIEESELEFIKHDFISHISSDKRIFIFSIPGFFFAGYHFWLLYNNIISFPFEVPVEFHYSAWMMAYALIFFFIVMYLIITSAYFMIYSIAFLRKVTQFPLKIHLLQARRRVKLDKTVSTILRVTIYWFIGVSLVMTVLYVYSSTVILVSLFLVVAIGLIFFFVPMLLFNHSIKTAKVKLLSKISSEFSQRISIPLPPEYDAMEALLLCAVFDQVERVSDWPFEYNTIFRLTGSIIVPIITALVGIITQIYI